MMGSPTNYSYETSLPAHRENPQDKQSQKEKILAYILTLGGSGCLKQIEEYMKLPQSSCAGRINDLIEEGKLEHEGFVTYKDRKRKKFQIAKPKGPAVQQTLPLQC